MPRLRPVEHALTLIAHPPRQQYVCRACRAHAIRQLHTTRPLAAELGFFQRMRDSLFGSQKSKEEDAKREKRTQERAKADAAKLGMEIVEDKRGKQYEVAAIVDRFVYPDYVEATKADGLPRIGGEKWEKKQLDQGEAYVGFVPERRAKLKDEQWAMLLRHVAVEVLALQKAGRDVNDVCLSRTATKARVRHIRNARISIDRGNRDASVTFASSDVEREILSTIAGAEAMGQQPREEQELDTDEAEEQRADGEESGHRSRFGELRGIVHGFLPKHIEKDTTWKDMRLQDPLIKFTIVKRIAQLTGHRIPDPAISNAHTLADLYTAFSTKPAPKKLADTPQLKLLRTEMPNVAVHSKRQTPIHKEKAIGRWKIIENELIARDLPVTGSRWPGAKPRLGVER